MKKYSLAALLTLVAGAFSPVWCAPAPDELHQPTRLEEAKTPAGIAYANGDNEDYLQTGGEYLKLTEKAFTRSQDALGVIYELGLSVKPDPEQAAKWYRLAAEQGYASGQVHLGRMYARGTGVEQDYAQACKWYARAAEQGLSDAQVLLGEMYQTGRGVERDRVQAWAWFDTAATNDTNPKAAEKRNQLGKQMTARQLQRAQALSERYVEKYAPPARTPSDTLHSLPAPTHGEA